MKKTTILGLSAVLLVSLASCTTIEKPLTAIDTGIQALQDNYKVTYEITDTRKFDSYFYSPVDLVTKYTMKNDYRYNDEHTIAKVKTYVESVATGEEEPVVSVDEEVVYDVKTGVIQDEFLNYKNEVEYRNYTNSGTSNFTKINEHAGYNYLKNLKASDFTLDEKTNVATYEGEIFSDMIYDLLGTTPEFVEATFTLEDGKFTGFTASFEPERNTYSNDSGDGEWLTETFAIKGDILYTPSVVKFLTPKEEKRDTTFDNAINKYDETKNNYTLTYSTNQDIDATEIDPMFDILFDGDKIVFDLIDLMGDGSKGTPSWFDCCVYENEAGQQYLKTLDMNYETEEINLVLTMEEAIKNQTELPEGEEFPDIPDEIFLLEKGLFDVDFWNINSSIFEKDENGVLTLTGLNAKYFGEAVVSRLCGFTPFYLMMGYNYSQVRWGGSEWKIKVLDNCIRFLGTFEYDIGGKVSHGTYSYDVSNIGTTDASLFYDHFAELEKAAA